MLLYLAHRYIALAYSLRAAWRHKIRGSRRQIAMHLEIFHDGPALVVAQQRPDHSGRQCMSFGILLCCTELFRCCDERVTAVVVAIFAGVEPEAIGFFRIGGLTDVADVFHV